MSTTSHKVIRDKVVALARGIGNDASRLKDDEEIPATGLLDSAAIMELILWLETRFEIEIDQESVTLENFGTINAIARYLQHMGKSA